MDAPPASLLTRLRERPTRAPETLALAATQRLGPPARDWARSHSGAGAAETAVRAHVRLARAEGAATGAAGALGIAPDLVALAWLQARMVLRVAAAHGRDPADPQRAAELLVLWGFFDDVGAARRTLDHEGRHLGLAFAGRARRRGDRGLVRRLGRVAGRRAVQRLGSRVVPVLGAFVASRQNAAATRELGERALRMYGG